MPVRDFIRQLLGRSRGPTTAAATAISPQIRVTTPSTAVADSTLSCSRHESNQHNSAQHSPQPMATSILSQSPETLPHDNEDAILLPQQTLITIPTATAITTPNDDNEPTTSSTTTNEPLPIRHNDTHSSFNTWRSGTGRSSFRMRINSSRRTPSHSSNAPTLRTFATQRLRQAAQPRSRQPECLEFYPTYSLEWQDLRAYLATRFPGCGFDKEATEEPVSLSMVFENRDRTPT